MNNKIRLKLIKGFLYLTGSFHLIVGVCGILSENLYRTIASLVWHATLELTPQYAFTSKLLSAYMIGFSLMIICIGLNPVKYRTFMMVAFATIFAEFLVSILSFSHISSIFSISSSDYAINLIVSLILQVGFVACFYQSKKLHDAQ